MKIGAFILGRSYSYFLFFCLRINLPSFKSCKKFDEKKNKRSINKLSSTNLSLPNLNPSVSEVDIIYYS